MHMSVWRYVCVSVGGTYGGRGVKSAWSYSLLQAVVSCYVGSGTKYVLLTIGQHSTSIYGVLGIDLRFHLC